MCPRPLLLGFLSLNLKRAGPEAGLDQLGRGSGRPGLWWTYRSVLSCHPADFDAAPQHFLFCQPLSPPGPAPNCPPPGSSLPGLSGFVLTQKKLDSGLKCFL